MTAGWRERAALEGARSRVRDTLRALEYALEPSLRSTPESIQAVTFGGAEIAVARFDGCSEPFLCLYGLERSPAELRAVGEWIASTLARLAIHREQREQAESEPQ